MKAIVAERGQITIPKILRVQLGIKPGTILDFQIQNSKLIALKIEEKDIVNQVYGCLKKRVHTNKIMLQLRGKA